MKDFLEPLAKLGRHDVVQDRIDGRVDVKHDSREVQEKVERFNIHYVKYINLQGDNPQGENLEGEHACEKEADHRDQHCHHLLS